MSLLMTTPIPVGDVESGSYTHLKIMKVIMDLENDSLALDLVPGMMVDGAFVPGIVRNSCALPGVNKLFQITGADYDAFVAAHEADYTAIKNDLYNWVIANVRDGTIV
jgi:hypothetical protein